MSAIHSMKIGAESFQIDHTEERALVYRVGPKPALASHPLVCELSRDATSTPATFTWRQRPTAGSTSLEAYVIDFMQRTYP